MYDQWMAENYNKSYQMSINHSMTKKISFSQVQIESGISGSTNKLSGVHARSLTKIALHIFMFGGQHYPDLKDVNKYPDLGLLRN